MKGPDEIVDRFAKGLRKLLAAVKPYIDEQDWQEIVWEANELLGGVASAVYVHFNIDPRFIEVDAEKGVVKIVKLPAEEQ